MPEILQDGVFLHFTVGVTDSLSLYNLINPPVEDELGCVSTYFHLLSSGIS